LEAGAEAGAAVAVLSETESRPLNIGPAELALLRLGAKPFHLQALTPPQTLALPIRSAGASAALSGHAGVLAGLKAAPLIIDLAVEGLTQELEFGEILASGARALTVSNEHPDALEPAARDALRQSWARRR
jgi:2,5-dihydroxypyridine 5,6-dioxygenase